MKKYTGPSTTLRPRPEVMRQFLDYWFAGCSGTVEIAWRDRNTKKVSSAEHFDIRDPALEKYACDINSTPGHDLYFTPALVSNTSGRASDKDFVQSPGFWVDQDDDHQVAHGDSVQHDFYPTSFVFTGRTPNTRRQMWFKLEEPTADFNLVRDTNTKLLGLYTGDPSVVNPSRLMRLPGGIAWPWKPNRVPELVSWEHPQDGRRARHPNALVETLPIPEPQLIEQKERGPAPTVSELIENIQADDNWHANMVRLVAHWVSRGMSDKEILVWAVDLTTGGYDAGETEAEMRAAIDGARNKWNRPDEDRTATTRYDDAVAAFSAAPALPAGLPDAETQDDGLFELLSLDELTARHGKKPDMLIEGFLTKGSTTMITGLPGTGKSPIAQHMSVCIALGKPWAGHTTMAGRVLYLAAESHSQTAMNLANLMKMELEASWGFPIATDDQIMKLVNTRILVMTSAFFLENDVPKLIKTIEREIAPEGRWKGEHGPDLLILDTLRAMSTGSVNDDQDMVAVQNQIALFKRRFPESAQILINHSPKGDPEGSLGSNRLDAFSEVIMNITHKKPHANANDDVVLKRPQSMGPDADGVKMSALAIAVQRNKTWTAPEPMRATLVVKENNMHLIYGVDSMAAERPHEGDTVEDSPFTAKEKKGTRKPPRPVAVPSHVQDASNSATSKADWVLKVVNASGVEFDAAEIAALAYQIDPMLFMGNYEPSEFGSMLSALANDEKIQRIGTGRGTRYIRNQLPS